MIASGQIRLGMTRDELHAVLGEPDDVGLTSNRYPVPCDWKYGDVEFIYPPAKSARHAQTHGLQMIYVDEGEGWEAVYLLTASGGPPPAPGGFLS